MSKQKAICILCELSNQDLEDKLEEFGHNVSVNFLTRLTVESKIIAKLDNYSDEEIEEFLQRLT